MLTSAPKFRVPEPCPERLAETPFSSYSLSSCIAALFELDCIPGRWEESEDWHDQLTGWAARRGLQVLELDTVDPVVGYHLRTVRNPDHQMVHADGETGPGVEFLLFYGDTLQFNPSQIEILAENLLPGKAVFLPLDPATTVATYN